MKLLWGARFAFGGRETPVRKLHDRREAGRVEATLVYCIFKRARVKTCLFLLDSWFDDERGMF